MPNAIKYSTTVPTGSLLKGTVALGVTTSSISGPTSTTGWYYGPNPVAGKYQIIETATSGDPDVFCPQNDNELIRFVRWKGATGANTGSVTAALAWIGTQSNLMVTNFEYPNIITNGLVILLDAGFVASYPGAGDTIYDLSGNGNHGTLYNGVGYSSNSQGVLTFDGVDDWVVTSGPNLISTNYTVMGAARYSGATRGRMITAPYSLNTNNWLMGHWNQSTENYYAEGWISPVGAGPNDTNWRIYSANGNISSDTYRFYINNIFSTQQTGGSAGPNRFAISGYGIGQESSTGEFSFLLAYNRILSDNEMTQNYNAFRGRFGL